MNFEEALKQIAEFLSGHYRLHCTACERTEELTELSIAAIAADMDGCMIGHRPSRSEMALVTGTLREAAAAIERGDEDYAAVIAAMETWNVNGCADCALVALETRGTSRACEDSVIQTALEEALTSEHDAIMAERNADATADRMERGE